MRDRVGVERDREREREWEGKGRREIELGKDRKNGGRVKERWRENTGKRA